MTVKITTIRRRRPDRRLAGSGVPYRSINNKYREIDQNPDLVGKLDQIIKQVGLGGSNVTNLSTNNANIPNNPMGADALHVRALGSYYAGNPFVGEYLVRKDNPRNYTQAQVDAINRNMW